MNDLIDLTRTEKWMDKKISLARQEEKANKILMYALSIPQFNRLQLALRDERPYNFDITEISRSKKIWDIYQTWSTYVFRLDMMNGHINKNIDNLALTTMQKNFENFLMGGNNE